jgi:FG-GAP-like repeat
LIPITVTFSSPVIVDASKGVPALLLNAVGPAGSAAAAASYVSGGSPDGTSSTLLFNYVVQPGQRIDHLDYLSSSSLTSQGQTTLILGSILDARTQQPISTPVLFDPGQPGSLAANSQISVGAAATGVTLVTSTLSDGTYPAGQVIPITVTFNNPVAVDTTGGTPTLALAVTGGTGTAAATYASGTGTDTLTFNFTPAAGQSSPALDYSSSSALSTNGGSVLVTGQNTPADLTLPPRGTPGSLGTSRVLAIAGQVPRVIAAWDNQTNQTVGVAGVIKIFVTLDGPVTVDTTGGTPTLTLTLDNNQTATAVYQPGPSGTSLEFDYTVAKGDQSADLDYVSAAALATNGGTVRDAMGQNANLTLPAPGTSGSLCSNNTTVAGDPPHVVSVTALSSNGGYGLDLSGTVNSSITIQVTFSALVNVDTTKGVPTLLLNSGANAVAKYNSLVDMTLPIVNFIYTIGANQSTPHLDYSSITALQLNGGSITDQTFGQVAAVLTLPVPGSAASLSGSSSLAVETDKNATPFVADVNSTAVNGTYGVGAGLPIVVTLGLPVTVTGTTQLQLLLANGRTALASYSSGSGTNVLTFTFNVAAGQGTPRLDDGGFLVLNGSTDLPLPAPGAAGSLGRNTRIAIDTSAAAPPVVQSVTAGVPDGQYRTGDAIPIQVHFSRPVLVKGLPQLALSTGSSAFRVNYSSGSGTDTLTFLYTIGAGQKRSLLDYASAAALSVPTGSLIVDALNQQPASLTLPVPGLAGSLSQTSLLIVGNPQSTTLIRSLATTTVLGGLSRVFAGQELILTANVTSAVAGDILNSGSVTFLDGSTALGTVPVTGGVASLSLQLSPGFHVIQAVFAGDPFHQGSISGSQEIRVDELVVKRSSIVDENGISGSLIRRIFPYGRGYFGGLSVAAADLYGDGISDIVVAPERGSRTVIRVFDGRTDKLIRNIVAFRGVPHRGVEITLGDVNGDGVPDILAQSRGRHATLVEYFDGRTGRQIGRIQKLPLPAGPAALRRR